jgi:diguanylate cyclase (GGDEF)-like protein
LALADLSERSASRRTRLVAGGFVLAMVGVGLVPSAFGDHPVRDVPAFIPAVGSLWATAELLTAYLLLSQFMVNGVRMFLALGTAYACTGLLTIPFLLSFPGALGGLGAFAKLNLAQTPSTLWAIWHFAFPLIVGAAVLRERWSGTRVLGAANLRRECIGALALVVVTCVAVGVLAFALGNVLPVFIARDGTLTRLFVDVVAPGVLLANATVAFLVLRRAPLTALQVWIAVTLAMASIDAVLNATTIGRFTPRWYAGKLLTLATASVVLVALLAEISALYRRVGALATIDPLTRLRNRRTFDESVAWVLRLLRRRGGEVAMLMIDVDFFKGYNDRYGHAAGDACLRRVAEILSATFRRRGDVVARYGGEEFVAILPETSLASAIEIAERARSGVEALAIPHAGAAPGTGVVTISIGVAHAHTIAQGDPGHLLAMADRALYAAKEHRNIVITTSRDDSASDMDTVEWATS